MRRPALAILAAIAFLFLVAPAAHAQSAIAGTVKDSSGGVLPGTVVEATSPALIEGTKSATTDESGNYRIIDLRPGLYVVTFTLGGFQPVKVEAIELAGEQTRTVNAEMKLGTVSEALTVSGAMPIVDVQNAVRVTSLDRQAIDTMPLANNVWEMAQLIPGIDIYATATQQASSVGGSYGATQVYMSTHGQSAAQNVVMVDGMTVSGLELNGTVQAYFNNDMNSEVTYQTSGISADRSGGGVTVNMIPREGGNRFSGDGKVSLRPNAWISDNSGRYNQLGLEGEASLRYLRDFTISQGGPIFQNKLWFFGSFHQFNTSDLVDSTVFDNGDQGYDDQQIRQGSIRLTWQASARTKLTGYYDKTDKTRAHEMDSNDDPETASSVWSAPHYGTGNMKLTATLTPRMLLEGGYSFNREYRDVFGQEGIQKERLTPEWYASASREGGGARHTAPAGFGQDWPARDNYQGSVSYVTGSHQIKAGIQWQTGKFFHSDITNADLNQSYDVATKVGNEWVLTVPEEVTVFNNPVSSRDRLNADLGIYAQDSWRIKRMTVNAGLRWEHINAQTEAWEAPEGRFVPARSVNEITNLPNWYDWAPRFSVVYDLFGNSRTAIKYAANRYNRAAATALANGFNVLTEDTEDLPWVDKNGDDIAQGDRKFIYNANGTVTPINCDFANDPGCEIDMAGLDPTGGVFGTPSAQDSYVGYPRVWNFEQLVEVQHALTRRLSLTGSWTRGSDRDQLKSVNVFRQPNDYLPYKIFLPIDGTPVTLYYPKDSATRTRLRGANSTLTYVEPLNSSIYYQYSIEFRMRPYAGAQIFGGFTMDRSDDVDCATSIAGMVVDPNSIRFCDDNNLAGIDDGGVFEQSSGPGDPGGSVPWAKDFRIGVSMPLPWYGVNLGVTYLNNDTGGITPTYSIIPGSGLTGTRYPDGLSTPGSSSATRKIASSPAPPCPQEYGCSPGAFVIPSACTTTCAPGQFVNVGAASTSTVTISTHAGGRVRRERLHQVDLKVSKTFRVQNFSILPTLEVYNLFNEDTIFGYQSGTYATSGGNYLIPSATLQSRIIGFGAQVRW